MNRAIDDRRRAGGMQTSGETRRGRDSRMQTTGENRRWAHSIARRKLAAVSRRAVFLAAAIAGSACGGGGEGGEDSGPGLDAREHEWTWIAVAGSRCMDGSETGFGINLDRASDRLLVFLEGGGACFSDSSCAGVAHQDGYGSAQLADFAAGAGGRGLFDRAAADNPAAGWSYVLVPYCTGDVHAGATEDGIAGRVHTGFGNVARAVGAVEEVMAGSLSRVLLTGQSAGGFGAAYNFDQVQRIFDPVPVDLLDDSGPAPPDAVFRPCLQTRFRQAWNLAATELADCRACVNPDGGGWVNQLAFLAEIYPDSRFGLVSSLRDATNRQVFGSGYPDCENPIGSVPADSFSTGISELRDVVYAPLANARAYTIDSDAHVWTNSRLSDTVVRGVSLAAWIQDLVSGADSWASVAP